MKGKASARTGDLKGVGELVSAMASMAGPALKDPALISRFARDVVPVGWNGARAD